MNIAALTAFIAVAYRLRLFSDLTPQARLAWNPHVFAFLADAGIVGILRDHNLIDLPEDEFAGYAHELGKINPNTRFLLLDSTAHLPIKTEIEWRQWKDVTRRSLTADLMDYAAGIFKPRASQGFDQSLVQAVIAATAELSLNANFWGESPAIVGLQRSYAGISVAVADCGVGLLDSFRNKSKRKRIWKFESHEKAALAAAVYNRREYGLYRAIDEICRLPNTWITLWSFDSELHVRRPLWDSIKHLEVEEIEANLPLPVTEQRPSKQHQLAGYIRKWHSGIRGVRISFEVSFKDRA